MDFTFTLSVFVAIVGLILYYVTNNKTMEVGKIMFWTGLLAALLKFGGFASLRIHG